MKTKALIDMLDQYRAENYALKADNERMRQSLLRIYQDTRGSLGIEAAAQAREDARQQANQKAHTV